MARTTIDGIGIDYELRGDAGAPAVALTPGGRFAKDSPGVPELADALVAGGRRVLLWDRPNCGASDLDFSAESESVMHADTLIALIGQLDLGPTALAAGSAGSRVSLIAASRASDAVSHLAIWWISGGTIGLLQLAAYYCGEPATLASQEGMEAVLRASSLQDQLRRNPRGRDILLAQDPAAFVETMQRWAAFYIPKADSPVPGMTPADFARLTMPTLIFRNGTSDISHTRPTSDWVHRLIPRSQMVDPPWGDDEWNERSVARNRGEAPGLFVGWPKLAPAILDFLAQ